MLSFSQCDIFPQLLHNSLYNNVYSISSTYTYSTVYNYTTQYTVCVFYICFLFTMWYFFTITAQFTLQQCLQHILNIYTRYYLQLHYPVYWLCCLYMLPLHNVTFFHNYCTIDSTTMSTAYPQHIHIVLFATTPHSILALLFIYAFLFTMWYFSKITVQFTLQQCLQHILNIYMRYCLQLHYPVCWLFCLHMLSFSQCEYFSTHYCTIVYMTMFTAYPQHIHTILFTITLPSILTVLFTFTFPFTMWIFFHSYYIIVYYTMFTVRLHWTLTVLFTITLPSILSVLFTYAEPFHNVIFFHNYCTIGSTTMSTAYPQHILRYCLQLQYPVDWLCCLFMLPLHNVTFFHNHCTIDSTTMSTAYPQHIHIVLFATTPHSILALLFINAFLFTMWYFSTMTAQFTLQQCLQHILNIYIWYCLQLHYPVYCLCYYIWYTFHSMIFFHNYCTIDSTTMSTAYPQHIHTILFTITIPSILTLLFIYASFTQCDIFSQLLHNWLYNNVYSISATYTYSTICNYSPQYTGFAVYICFPFHNVIFFHNDCTIHSTTMFTAYSQHIHTVLFTITLPSMLTVLFTYAILFTMWYFSTMTAQFTLQQCLQHILNIYIRYCLQLHYPVYCLCYYICYTFHNMIFFHNYCTIDSTTMSTAYPQHIHTVLFTITLPSILTLLFIYASFTQCDIFSQLLHNWLYNNVYSISATYTYSTICNYSPQYTGFAVYICFPFHNVIFFHNDCTIHSTTMFTAYSQHIHTVLFTITLPSILTVLFTYAILFTMWYFSTMTAQFTLQQCLQHILNIYIRYCLQLHYPVYCLCYYICYTFHSMIFFHNYCTIDSTTMSTAYPQHIHTILFTITLPSILTLLFIYASFTQCDIYSQLLHNWLYNNVYSISATYTYSTVYNYSPQYTGFAVYICCPFHNVIFFHNYCTIHSTTMFTAYPQHIHTVLFTITLPSILYVFFTYASFSQCDIFSQSLPNSLYNNVYSISSTYTHDIIYNYTTQYTDFAVYICFLYTMWHFFTITAQLTLQQCLQHIRNIYI